MTLSVDLDDVQGVDPQSWSALARLGRALHVREADLPRTLEALATTAVGVLPTAQHAGINLYVRGKFAPQVVTGEPPHRLDQLQMATGAGPCIEASRTQVVVRIDNTMTDQRWPQWAAAAVSLGVCSLLCLPMWIDDLRLGSLSLYAEQPSSFSDRDEHIAELLALHAAAAIADAQRTNALRIAISHRDVIGMAKGMLIQRDRLDPDQAFTVLQKRSQHLNRKLVDIAEELVRTGQLP